MTAPRPGGGASTARGGAAPEARGGGATTLAARACGAVAVVLLAAPTAVGFASGGYFAVERLWAGLAGMVLLAVAAVAAPRPLPATAAGRLALAGLAGLLAWTALSRTWAPEAGPAINDVQRLALYLAVLIAAAAVLRGRWARAAEPAVAAGAVLIVGYGLSERLLPGLIDLDDSRAALGRLDQPLTYWNAMGAMAAMALVLLARIGADPARPRAFRIAAGALAAPMGAGLLLAFSRGAIAATVVGLVVLALLAPERVQLRAAVGVAALAAAGGALAAVLPAVRTMAGARETEGLILLAGLLGLAALGAWAAARLAALPPGTASAARRVRVGVVAAVAVVGLALVAISAAVESGTPRDGASAARLGSADSNRYAYWRVAIDGFADAPLRGHGTGSFGVLWLRDRTVPEVVRDAHSIWLETAAELGLVGLLLLGAFAGGVGWAAALARRRDAARLAGPAATLAVWAAHSAIDWDWELPGGPTLTALVLAGLVIALADPPTDAPPAR
jgi:hypothetical protein